MTFILASGFSLKGEILLYIIFIKFFFTDFPNVSIPLPTLIHFILIILPHVILSTFILISGFKCFSNVLDFYMCSCLPFHMLSLFFPCALTLFTTFSELLWHLIFLCFIFATLPTYPDAVYKPMYLLSSSSVCKLMLILLISYLPSKSPLSSHILSLLSHCSPCPLVTIYLLRQTSDPPILRPDLWPNSRTLV